MRFDVLFKALYILRLGLAIELLVVWWGCGIQGQTVHYCCGLCLFSEGVSLKVLEQS